MKRFASGILTITAMLCFAGASSVSEIPSLLIMDLWPDGAPDGNGLSGPEEEIRCGVTNVSKAAITVHLPPKAKATGAAVVITPGGGYAKVCVQSEGQSAAEVLLERGIAAIVVKYRLPNGHHEIPARDARRAIRTVRYHASEWNIDPSRIGVWGFSAGGHLASTVATVFDSGKAEAGDPIERQGSRPDFAILFYPVITMEEGLTHAGSRENLIGPDAADILIERYSNENRVNSDTPPIFLLHCSDDRAVPVENSLRFYRNLVRYQIRSQLLIFEEGGHGTNAFEKNPSWRAAFDEWLQRRGCR